MAKATTLTVSISREKLRNAVYQTYYLTYVEEVAADRLIHAWQLVDEVTKLLVAVTASGSAVSGWALWNQPHWKPLWIVMAAVGALLSIVHATLAVPERVKSWTEAKQLFAKLRIDLQTFRQQMGMDAGFDPAGFAAKFVEYRERYGEVMQRKRNDVLWTKAFEKRVAEEVDDLLAKEDVTAEFEAPADASDPRCPGPLVRASPN